MNRKWPRRVPVYGLTCAAIALVIAVWAVNVWMKRERPEQRFYLKDYIWTSIYAGSKPKPYDVQLPGGAVIKVWMLPKGFNAWLKRGLDGHSGVFEGQDADDFLKEPAEAVGVLALLGLFAGAALDRRHNRNARKDIVIEGPRIVTRWEYNRRMKGDGLRIRIENRRNFFEWLQGEKGYDLVIPKSVEAQHLAHQGDTGAGKSTSMRKELHYIESVGETAIVVDTAREFITEFYDPERGDLVLNVLDERTLRWLIEDEAFSEAAYTATAVGLLPDKVGEQSWFNDHARSIFAYLLHTYHPSVEVLCDWLADENEMDRLLAGTEHAVTLVENAPQQRAGILGTLNKIGKALRLMPTAAEERGTWSVRDYVQGDRKRWVFITCTPETADALQPIMSLWLDMFILGLQMNAPREDQKRVWIAIDEVTEKLNQIPKLKSGLTQNRKYDNPILLGYQSYAFFEALYGRDIAEGMLSQPFTQIIMRAGEERTATHLSGRMGQQRVERLTETRNGNRWWPTYSYSTTIVTQPAVMPSAIQGLPNLSGYFLQLDMIVPFTMLPGILRRKAEPLIARMIPERKPKPVAPEAKPAAAPEKPAVPDVRISGSVTVSGPVGKKVINLDCRRCHKVYEIADGDPKESLAEVMARHGWLWKFDGEDVAICGTCATAGNEPITKPPKSRKKERPTDERDVLVDGKRKRLVAYRNEENGELFKEEVTAK